MAGRADLDTPGLRAITEAKAAVKAAEDALTDARAKLLAAMVEEANRGQQISQIARAADLEQPYVRRTLRAAGVKARQPNRVPPPGFKRAPTEPDEVDA